MPAIVLASASPRRLDLLRRLGLDPLVRPTDIDETHRPGEPAIDYVLRLAESKAMAIDLGADDVDTVVVAADTTVEAGGVLLGKPDDADHARSMLRHLSGTEHHVHTGVCVRVGSSHDTVCSTTTVRFRDLADDEIDRYVASGEPFGKAGSCSVQGAGGAFVLAIEGSETNVVGLPLTETVALGRRLGVDLFLP